MFQRIRAEAIGRQTWTNQKIQRIALSFNIEEHVQMLYHKAHNTLTTDHNIETYLPDTLNLHQMSEKIKEPLPSPLPPPWSSETYVTQLRSESGHGNMKDDPIPPLKKHRPFTHPLIFKPVTPTDVISFALTSMDTYLASDLHFVVS